MSDVKESYMTEYIIYLNDIYSFEYGSNG
jgi:hypothetical protein